MVSGFQTIEKEKIGFLQFPKSEVLNDNFEIRQRHLDLNRAQTLGNLEHSKIKIFIEDNETKRVVETTVWAVTEESVVLKQGVRIPINRIYKSI